MAESARYKVIGKFIYRTTTQDITMGTRPDGSPNVVRQPGPMAKVEVGTILDDVTPAELAAAPDRFALVDEKAESAEPSGAGLALVAPLRGVYEPANALDASVQKPPLTAPEVEARMVAQKAVAEVETRHATEAAERAKELEETRAKAFTEAATQAAQPAAAPSRASARSTPPATPPERTETPRRSS